MIFHELALAALSVERKRQSPGEEDMHPHGADIIVKSIFLGASK
jgi:hypothetical protein